MEQQQSSGNDMQTGLSGHDLHDSELQKTLKAALQHRAKQGLQNDDFAQNSDKANEMANEHNDMVDDDPVNPEEIVRGN